MRHRRPLAHLLSLTVAASLAVAPASAATSPTLSEIRINGGGDAAQEFVEIAADPGTSLDGLTHVVIGDGAGGSGVIEAVIDLTGAVPASGYFVLAESTFTLGTPDQTADLNFENGDNVTHLLVEGFSGAVDDDLDTNDDGTLDSTPWTSELDRVALIEEDNPPTGTEFHYGPPTVGPDGSFVPAHAYRCPEGWRIGAFGSNDADTPGADNPCTATPALVHEVQGDGAASPLAGSYVEVQAIVTGLFEDDEERIGFFVQEEDADADADPATSEGVYVDCEGACPPDVAEGDLVTVTAVVVEEFGRTVLDADGVTIDSSGNPLPAATEVTLPAATGTDQAATFEHVEGMLVTIPTTLVVSEYFSLARYGELVLTAGERPHQFTHDNDPDAAGYGAYLEDLATRRIVLDDADAVQNDAISFGDDDPYAYPSGGLSLTNRFRGGDTITDLTAVMDWGFGEWRLQPLGSADYTFEPANPRTAAPAAVGGELTVATLNVLNYFTTVDDGVVKCPADSVSLEDLDCRGADSEAELVRQRDKIVAALTAMDADIVGLVELENAPGVIADLVAGLNAATAPGTYAGIETGPIGPDVIRVGLIYQPANVTPVGDHAVFDSVEFVNAGTEAPRNRAALAQTFADADGAHLTVVVNHFKSKSGSEYDDRGGRCVDGEPANDTANCDQGDGQAYFNEARTVAAQLLDEWLATDPTGSGDADVLIVGDLNAYANEDPITTLEDAGWTDLVERFEGADAYSYVFDGQLGYLDHALANERLLPQVAGVTVWHINTDEPNLFDYNDAVEDAGERWFERESAALPLYAADPYRASDHDPVLVGLNLDAPPVADLDAPANAGTDEDVTLDASGSTDPDGDALAFAWDLDDDGRFDDASGPTVVLDTTQGPGTYPVAVRVTDPGGHNAVAEATVEVALEEVPVARTAGAARVETAIEISKATYPEGTDVAVLALSTRYPDALAASPLAAQLDAPILLSAGDRLDPATSAELERLGVTRVVIVGGPAAISEEIESVLDADYDVERIAGPERYATAAAIAAVVADALPADATVRVYVAQGQPRADQAADDGWQDALAAAPVAAFHEALVLLTPSTELAAPTAEALADLGVDEAIVVGGRTAVTPEVYEEIDAIVGDTTRVFGPDRYATSAAVARWAEIIGMDPARTWIATGTAFPDALVAGPSVAAAGGILLLVDGQNPAVYDGSAPEAWLDEHAAEIFRATLLGGPAAITDAVRDLIAATLAR